VKRNVNLKEIFVALFLNLRRVRFEDVMRIEGGAQSRRRLAMATFCIGVPSPVAHALNDASQTVLVQWYPERYPPTPDARSE